MGEHIVYNENELKIETPEGFKSFDGVMKVENTPCLKFITENDNHIIVSINHKFIISSEAVLANELMPGMVLELRNGFEKIISIEFAGYHDVYDILEVKSSDHSFYANDIKNSNCKFLGSSSTLVEADCLERIKTINAISTKYGDLMQIFEPPQAGSHHYVLGVDSAGGTGADYSIIQVLKIVSHTEIYQVATYANNMISPHNFAEICIGVSDYYFQAGMMVENNEMGGQVADKIWYDFECDRIFNTDPKGIGTRSTRKSKLIANMLAKRYIEEGWLKLNNSETVRQFGMYEEVTPNVFRGPRTDHDDQVTSIIWGLYYLQTPFFEGDLTSVRRSISEVYKIIPDEEADREMLKKRVLSNNSVNSNNAEREQIDDSDDGIRPPITFDDDDSFEWPNSLDD